MIKRETLKRRIVDDLKISNPGNAQEYGVQGNHQGEEDQAGDRRRGSENGIHQCAGLAGSDAVAAEGAGISRAPLRNFLGG
jgi:hypothetical protein